MGMLLLVENWSRFGPTQEICLQSTEVTSTPKQFYKPSIAAGTSCSRWLATILCRSKNTLDHPLEKPVGVFSDSYLNTQVQPASNVTVNFTKFIFAHSHEKQVTWAVTAKASSG